MLPNVRAVAYTSFCHLWRSLVPNIMPTRPMTDLCALCHKNAGLIMRNSNLSEVEKSQVCKCFSNEYITTHLYLNFQTLKEYEQHLHRASVERSLYKTHCDRSKQVYKELTINSSASSNPSALRASIAASVSPPCEAHYSFDFAQQVHIPADPLQPGPMYFLTPRKCALFGVCCEGVPFQVINNYSTYSVR